MRRLTAPAALAAAAILFASAGLAAAGDLPAQTSNAQAVAVQVKPRSLEGPVWEFEVSFNTHSQDLQDDLLKTSVLVGPDGRQVAPLAWKGAAPGGHHRSGVLRFAAVQPLPDPLVLRMQRPGEAQPRVFQWRTR